MRLSLLLLAVSSVMAATLSAAGPVLWQEPAPLTVEQWTWGPGGKEKAPQPPLTFVKEDKGGTTPKVIVQDAKGATYLMKFGTEVNSDTFVPRLAQALGYYSDATYFMASGKVDGAKGLGRAKSYVNSDGSFRNARLKFMDPNVKYADEHGWSWISNPFRSTPQLRGLRILMLLTSNWDAKDSRDGDNNSNTAILRRDDDPNAPLVYEINDWGSAMGKWGGFFKREKWDCEAFMAQSDNFVTGIKGNGSLKWGFSGKHADDMTREITAEDVRWILPYLERITDEQWEAGLRASGGTQTEVDCFIRSLKSRITQLHRAANSGM